jgi:SAM-dependent methyltransferase
MQPGEYELMDRVEQSHWWYLALRDVLTRIVRDCVPALPANPRVLDVGCGTGANLALLAEELRPSYLGGFDVSKVALDLARRKVPHADLYESDLRSPELRQTDLDLVISMDVVCFPGLEPTLPGLERIVERLAPGGRLILNLPAYRWLYSEHDMAVHNRERYSKAELRGLLKRLDLAEERLTYRMFTLFPAIAAARLTRLRRQGAPLDAARSDLHGVPGNLTNRLLFGLTRWESRYVARGRRLPWGSSLLAVGRKP